MPNKQNAKGVKTDAKPVKPAAANTVKPARKTVSKAAQASKETRDELDKPLKDRIAELEDKLAVAEEHQRENYDRFLSTYKQWESLKAEKEAAAKQVSHWKEKYFKVKESVAPVVEKADDIGTGIGQSSSNVAEKVNKLTTRKWVGAVLLAITVLLALALWHKEGVIKNLRKELHDCSSGPTPQQTPTSKALDSSREVIKALPRVDVAEVVKKKAREDNELTTQKTKRDAIKTHDTGSVTPAMLLRETDSVLARWRNRNDNDQ